MNSFPLVKIDRGVFASAQQNMDYDIRLLNACTLESWARIFRVYIWPKAGITLPGRQVTPSILKNIDTGFRPTGGGIVFHSPGDIVFSLIMGLDDTVYPKRLKEKIAFITQKIAYALLSVGISTCIQSSQSNLENMAFCKTYFSPNELYFNGHKICGVTFKRYKDKGLLQGVIHLESGVEQFSGMLNDEMNEYLTTQGIAVDKDLIVAALIKEFS